MAELQRAARQGHAAVVQALLAANAEVNAPASKGGWTALHVAAGLGHVDVVEALLQAAGDPNAKDGDGRRPLQWAEWSGHRRAALTLRLQGAGGQSDPGILAALAAAPPLSPAPVLAAPRALTPPVPMDLRKSLLRGAVEPAEHLRTSAAAAACGGTGSPSATSACCSCRSELLDCRRRLDLERASCAELHTEVHRARRAEADAEYVASRARAAAEDAAHARAAAVANERAAAEASRMTPRTRHTTASASAQRPALRSGAAVGGKGAVDAWPPDTEALRGENLDALLKILVDNREEIAAYEEEAVAYRRCRGEEARLNGEVSELRRLLTRGAIRGTPSSPSATFGVSGEDPATPVSLRAEVLRLRSTAEAAELRAEQSERAAADLRVRADRDFQEVSVLKLDRDRLRRQLQTAEAAASVAAVPRHVASPGGF
eukprot:TRINITY_DN56242_c0_g1_i1.p1 TRINITY_DN56242_c0_g1~~TRINITY_DN56242_c0_g1_i1.p1  ORF type:complete len:432 (+),score=113.48 TRINITY_DN56242_c0_g1_i1:117-1412(+)